MIDAINRAIELIRELFLGGFVALVAVPVAAPLLGAGGPSPAGPQVKTESWRYASAS